MAVATQSMPLQRAMSKRSVDESFEAKRCAIQLESLSLQTATIVKDYIFRTAQGHRYPAIHRYCLKVLEDHKSTLQQLCKKLKPSRQSLHSNFMRVFGTLFGNEITVGKIVTSIAFGGKLIEYCNENALDVTDNIIAWMLDYFKNYLSDWILSYGGWVR